MYKKNDVVRAVPYDRLSEVLKSAVDEEQYKKVEGREILIIGIRLANTPAIYHIYCSGVEIGGWVCPGHLMDKDGIIDLTITKGE